MRKRIKRGVKTAMMAVALMAAWAMVGMLMLNVWAGHPAEQQVSGAAYLEMVGGES